MAFSKTIRGMKVSLGASKATGKASSRAIAPSFLPAVVETMRRDEGGPRPVAEYVRASAFAGYCFRAEAIERIWGDPHLAFDAGMPIRDHTATPLELLLTFEFGRGFHDRMQNHVLGPAGLLLGRWLCLACGASWGTDATPVKSPEFTHAPPTFVHGGACSHHGPFNYREPEAVNETLGIGGHMDGFIEIPEFVRPIGLEMKTISERMYDDLTKPLPEHVVQANVYFMLFGIERMLFLYACKGWVKEIGRPTRTGAGFAWGPLKEYVIAPDPAFAARVQLRREQVNTAVELAPMGVTQLPPKRGDCKLHTSARCRECKVADICWSV